MKKNQFGVIGLAFLLSILVFTLSVYAYSPPNPAYTFYGDATGDMLLQGDDIPTHINCAANSVWTNYATTQPHTAALAWNTCDLTGDTHCTQDDITELSRVAAGNTSNVTLTNWEIVNLTNLTDVYYDAGFRPFQLSVDADGPIGVVGRPGIIVKVRIASQSEGSEGTGSLRGRSCDPDPSGSADQINDDDDQCAVGVTISRWSLSPAPQMAPTQTGTYGLKVAGNGDGDLRLVAEFEAQPLFNIPATSLSIDVTFQEYPYVPYYAPPDPNYTFYGDATGDMFLQLDDMSTHRQYAGERAYRNYNTLQPHTISQAWNTCDLTGDNLCTQDDIDELGRAAVGNQINTQFLAWELLNHNLPSTGNDYGTWIPFQLNVRAKKSEDPDVYIGRPGIIVKVTIDEENSEGTGYLSGRSCDPDPYGDKDQLNEDDNQCAVGVSITDWQTDPARALTELGDYGLQVWGNGDGPLRLVAEFEYQGFLNVPTTSISMTAPFASVNIACADSVDELSTIQCAVTSANGTPAINTAIDTCGGTLSGSGPWTYSYTPTETEGPGTCVAAVLNDDADDSELVTINEVNEAPTDNAPSSVSGDELTWISFSMAPTDPDIPTQTLISMPIYSDCVIGGDISFIDDTISIIPAEGDGPQSCDIVTTVFDGVEYSSDVTTRFIVREVNVAPTDNAPASISAEEMSILSFDISPTDSDIPVQTLTSELVSATGSCSNGSLTGHVWSWATAEGDGPTSCDVVTRVSDGELYSSDVTTHVILLNYVNDPPTDNAPANVRDNEMSQLSFNTSPTDTDYPPQTLTSEIVSASGACSNGALSGDVWSWTTTEADGPTSCDVVTRIFDGELYSSNVTTHVIVNEVNTGPTNNAPTTAVGNENTLISFSTSPTDPDLPAQTLTSTVVTVDGACTNGTLTGDTWSWTPTEAQGPTSCWVETQIQDSYGEKDFVTTRVIVNEVNVAPTDNAPSSVSGDEKTTVSFNTSPTDADLPAQTLISELVSATGACTNGSLNGHVWSWTTTEADGPTSCDVVTRVYDNVAYSSNVTTHVIVIEVKGPFWTTEPVDITSLGPNSSYNSTNGQVADDTITGLPGQLTCSAANNTCSFGVTITGSGTDTASCNISFTAGSSPEMCTVDVVVTDQYDYSISKTINIRLRTEWTILAYVGYGFAGSMNNMESGGSSQNVNVVAMYDPDNGTDTAKYYYITQDDAPSTINSPILEEFPETTNMGDQETLEGFLNYGIQNYPAKHYAVFLVDHGGITITVSDKTAGDDLSIQEIRDALANVTDINNLEKIDILVHDACIMQFADASPYTLRNNVNYLIASELNSSQGIIAYWEILPTLSNNPTMSPLELGRLIIERFNDSDTVFRFAKGFTLSLIDLSTMDALASAMDNLAHELIAAENNYHNEICKAQYSTDRDLYNFVYTITKRPTLPFSLKDAAYDVMDVLQSTIVMNGDGEEQYYGLAINLPREHFLGDDEYGDLDFSNDTDWDDFYSNETSRSCPSAIFYVKQDALPDGSGVAWDDAENNIQTAINKTKNNDSIWVAQGDYPAQYENGLRLWLRINGKNINIYGGFLGDETDLSQRPYPLDFPSIIHDSEVIIPQSNGDTKQYELLRVQDSNVVIDGLLFKNYYGTLSNVASLGGSDLTVRNCIFQNQTCNQINATDIWSVSGSGLNIENCYFNSCGSAAIRNVYSLNTQIKNCIFITAPNYNTYSIKNEHTSPDIKHCTFFGTPAIGNSDYSSPCIKNSILWGASNVVYNDSTSTVTIEYSDIEGGYTGTGNINSDPLFVNAPLFYDMTTSDGTTNTIYVQSGSLYVGGDVIEIGDDNVPRTITDISSSLITFSPALSSNSAANTIVENWGPGATDLEEDFHLDPYSPCIDAGADVGITSDIENNPRPSGSGYDMGAYEYQVP